MGKVGKLVQRREIPGAHGGGAIVKGGSTLR